MIKTLKTIYELFCNYTEKEIEDVIENLSSDDKLLIYLRYGDDFHNPVTSKDWDSEKTKKFYGHVIPKINRQLSNNRKQMLVSKEKSNLGQVLETIPAPIYISNIDYSSKIYDMLERGVSSSEMCKRLNISSNQLYDELLKLKNKGIAYSRKYFSDGSITYRRISAHRNLNSHNKEILEANRTIFFNKSGDKLKALVISDLHFGNELERIDLVNRAFNYCKKNNINIILCGGDIIDGCFSMGKQKISNPHEQLEYFMKNYPQDKNILTFSVGGDHDSSALCMASVDMITAFENFRHDFVMCGYSNAIINVNNDKIQLYHHNRGGRLIFTSAPIVLHGHSHKYFVKVVNNVLHITLPTLSNIMQPMPTALELEFSFINGYIDNVIVKQIYFDSQDILLSEFVHKVEDRTENNQEDVMRKTLENNC